MEEFYSECEKEIMELVNMEDDENKEYYKYTKEGYEWSIQKNILEERNKSIVIKQDFRKNPENHVSFSITLKTRFYSKNLVL